MKFSQKYSESDMEFTAVKNIEMEIDQDATLSHALEAFGQFLKACGYSFTGEIEVVDNTVQNDEA